MKRAFLDDLGNKAPYIVIFLSLTSATAFFVSKYYAKKSQNAQILKDGLQTCLSRLNLSYKTKISGNTDTSFLQGPFITDTEGCFSEVISYSENSFRSLNQKMSGILHFLSSETYWLHHKLTGKSKKVFSHPNDDTAVSNEGKKFQTIQTKANQVVSFLQSQYSLFSNRSSFFSYITSFLLILVVCQSLYELYSQKVFQKKKAILNNSVSEVKQTLLSDGLRPSFDRISEKAFRTGTKVNLKVDEECNVPLEREKLIDFLFYSMNSAMNLGSKAITIETKKCGKESVVNILGHGVKFSKDFLEQEKSEEAADIIAPEYAELQKLRKIVGNDGTISFSNRIGRQSFAIGLSSKINDLSTPLSNIN